jgi:hypothetical protein
MTASGHFNRLFSKENLVDIYTNKVSLTETVGIDRIHPEALEKILDSEIFLIEKNVHAGAYHFTAYKEVLLTKGAGSPPRVVAIPTARDRIVLRALFQVLAEVFPEAISSIAQVKIATIIENMERFEYGEFLKIDVNQFYPSIDHSILLKKIKRRIKKPEILKLIRDSITTPTVPTDTGSKGSSLNTLGIPQGLAISNLLAEIYMHDFDSQMSTVNGLTYQRYVDDILVLCPTGNSSRIFNDIDNALRKIGLTPHKLNASGSKSKSGLISSDFQFLGYFFSNRLISPRIQSIRKLESAFASILTSYKHKFNSADTPEKAKRALDICEFRLNLRITGCVFEGKRLGWMFYFSKTTNIACIRALDHTVDCLLQRFHIAGKIKVKRLLKTYYECRRTDKASHNYITNFDDMSIDKQRHILSMLTGLYKKIQCCSDEEIIQLCKMKIGKAVQELKADISNIS